MVALRKESVDRNATIQKDVTAVVGSLSARRAWIEIPHYVCSGKKKMVALRKESVDRNNLKGKRVRKGESRSPQGERG